MICGRSNLIPEFHIFYFRHIIPDDGPWSSILTRDFWGGELNEYSHQSYRPLTTVTLKLESVVFGSGFSIGRHLINLALHWAVCVQFYQLSASRILALVFATHPILSEAVIR